MAAKNKVCEYCGEWFTPHKNVGKRQRFCCEECQRAWWLENRKEAGKQYTYICQNCGKEYKTTYADRNTCCSRECAWELNSKRSLIEKQCVSCGKTFVARNSDSDYCSDECRDRGIPLICSVCGESFYGTPNAIYCSDKCRLAVGRVKYEEYMLEKLGDRTYICEECGKEFVAPYGDKRRKFCSSQCQERNYKKSANGKAARTKQRHMRRARKYGNGPVEAIDFNVVCERDGWRCGICGEKVSPNLKHPHPMSATLDHIIPLAQGGTHTWGNVQLAHFICNCHKGADGGGQLRLGITINVE